MVICFTVFQLINNTSFGQSNSAWSTTGPIGIGTPSPNALFHVHQFNQLGVDAGDMKEIARFSGLSHNYAQFKFQLRRWAYGAGWNSSSGRLQFTTDATDQGYMEFNPMDEPNGIAMGYGTNEFLRINGAGNVGIGTASPQAKLHVAGSMILGNTTGANTLIVNDIPGARYAMFTGGYNLSFAQHNASTDQFESRMTLANGGNVGIGVSNPWARLDIRTTGTSSSDQNAINLQNPSSASYATVSMTLGSGAQSLSMISAQRAGNSMGSSMFFQTSDVSGNVHPRLWINEQGKVGIGTLNPQAELAVNGDIYAKKVKVTQTGWADFVFHPNYKLLSLEDLHAFIKKNGHLPDVPSEKDILEGGQDIGTMNKILLQKVEELTLYILEQNEQTKKMSLEIEDLKVKITQLSQKEKSNNNK